MGTHSISIGLVITALLAVYLFVALFPRGGLLMRTIDVVLSSSFTGVVLAAACVAARQFHGRGLRGAAARFLSRVVGPLERLYYRLAGIDATAETGWVRYTVQILMFNLIGLVVVYALQRLQALLPLNPAQMSAVSPDSSFNTAVSFITNTNWQGYGGESTMSYLTQMLALAVQNFFSAATGMAVLVALVRGFTRKKRVDEHRQYAGRPHPQHAVHSAADVAGAGGGVGHAGRGAELLALRHRDDDRPGGL